MLASQPHRQWINQRTNNNSLIAICKIIIHLVEKFQHFFFCIVDRRKESCLEVVFSPHISRSAGYKSICLIKEYLNWTYFSFTNFLIKIMYRKKISTPTNMHWILDGRPQNFVKELTPIGQFCNARAWNEGNQMTSDGAQKKIIIFLFFNHFLLSLLD